MHRAEPSAGLIVITGSGDQLPPESVITFDRNAQAQWLSQPCALALWARVSISGEARPGISVQS
jgi:hypothetical protein